MTTIEIVLGAFIIFAAVIIIALVAMQESKGNGLSGALGGDMMLSEGRGRSNDLLVVKYTKYFAIGFFILILAMAVVGLFS